jgi:hypothetical protein
MPIDPLRPGTPIVDAQGRPTKEFLQQWEKLRRLVADVPGVAGDYDTAAGDVRFTVNAQGKIESATQS